MVIDAVDRKILARLQEDATLPLAEIAGDVGLLSAPCWRRIQKLEEAGAVRKRVALPDGAKLNCGVTVFASVRTDQHTAACLRKFASSVAAYDSFYRRLIDAVDLSDVNSNFAMEQIKYTTSLPLDYA